MKLYRIKDWENNFENAKSKTIDRCSWCPMPNKQDGLGYGRLLRMENGTALYGAFVAVVLVASKQKCPRKGYLTETGVPSGYPLSATDLSVKTQIPKELIDSMFSAVCSIGWIELTEVSPQGHREDTEVPPQSLERRKEGKKEEQAKVCSGSSDFSDANLPTVEEVISFGASFKGEMARGVPGPIPKEFCEAYHEAKTSKNTWLNRDNRLVNWRSEIIGQGWWRSQWQKWKKNSTNPKSEHDILNEAVS